MGTPDFAAASLRRLLDDGFDVVGVFTQPDKPKNRGMKLAASPVKTLALEAGLPVFQPEKLRTGDAYAQLSALRPDVLAVVAYGKILPDDFLALPRCGAVNVHGSLLPRYRGAAPIQWAVLNGDEKTGVSTMYLDREMDTGDVIYAEETEIGEYETAGELFDRLADMGAALLARTLREIEMGTAPRTPQDHALATYTRPLDKSLCPIDWDRAPRAIVKQICGLSPWPVATARIADADFKIFRAEYCDTKTALSPGQVVSAGKDGITVACANGETLRVTELQAPGKKRMRAADYLLGHPMQAGS